MALLHVRLVVGAGHRDAILTFLQDHVGITNVVWLRDAAVQPSGDVLLFDVARESSNEVLRVLREVGIERDGSISVHHARLSLGDAAQSTVDLAEGSSEAAVMWAEVDANVRSSATIGPGYLAYFVVAAVIAAAGVLSDAPVLIVGAMVVGPEFGPLAAISYAIERRRWRLLRGAITTLAVGSLAAMAAGALLVLALRAIGEVPHAYEAGVRPLTSFVSRPDLLSAVVAAAAAVAGMLALTHERADTLVGVLVSVTTIPAIAAIGISIAEGDWHELGGAAGQLGVNVACLVVSGSLTLRVLRWATPRTVSALRRRAH